MDKTPGHFSSCTFMKTFLPKLPFRSAFAATTLLLLPTGKSPAASDATAPGWRAGVATAKITPQEPVWMAGYASRNHPSQGVVRELFAKALALEDERGGKLVIVTMDEHMVPRGLRDYVEKQTATRYGLKPEQLLVNASHTHCGPELRTEEIFYEESGKEVNAAAIRYRTWLEGRLADLVGEALSKEEPARLEHSHARAGFAMNRRRPDPNGRISLSPYPAGPVDHEVPSLKVTGAQGELRAVLFGYACHNTTSGGDQYQINGDYAGFAQENLEATYRGAVALFMAGCGGDQDPQPRGSIVPGQTELDLARQHGRALANAVSTALVAGLKPVRGPLSAGLGYADLPYQVLARAEVEKRAQQEKVQLVRSNMRRTLQQIDQGTVARSYPLPVQVVQFGQDLTLVAIGGEVVVDYALRLKRELAGPGRVWVAGYSNDGYAYIGNRRVIEEGGYEGYSANLRTHPGPWAPAAEEAIIAKVHEIRGRLSKP